MKEVNDAVKSGHIVIVGAVWCKACKNAKAAILKKFPDTPRHYVDFDEDEDAVTEHFPSVKKGLPGVFGCSGPGQYEELEWKDKA